MRLSVFLCALLLLASLSLVAALSPPPVFEHHMPRNYKGTNCEACQAVVKQAMRKMGEAKPDLSTQKLRRAREQKVSELVDGLCAVESFGRYEYSPPTMVSACHDFLSEYGEDLEELLYKGEGEERAIRQQLCVDSGLCKELWNAEQEELKRDRTPEETQREKDEAEARAKERERKEKEEKRKEKKEKLRKKKEEQKKKKQEAADKEAQTEQATQQEQTTLDKEL